jgi:hypothetical protein
MITKRFLTSTLEFLPPRRPFQISLPVAAFFAYCTTRPTFNNGFMTGIIIPTFLFIYCNRTATGADSSRSSSARQLAAQILLVFFVGYTSSAIHHAGYVISSVQRGYPNLFLIHSTLGWWVLRRLERVGTKLAVRPKTPQKHQTGSEGGEHLPGEKLETGEQNAVANKGRKQFPSTATQARLILKVLPLGLMQCAKGAMYQVLMLRFVCVQLCDHHPCLVNQSWTRVWLDSVMRLFVVGLAPSLAMWLLLAACLHVSRMW